MTTATTFPQSAENWLDMRGKPAWIAATVLGFIVFWPVGLALLAYMIWSKRMFRRSGEKSARHDRNLQRNSSGNSVFDNYKEATLRRLEEEQDAFQAFLDRLRDAKDKSEFDAFMEERATSAKASNAEDDTGENTDKKAPSPA